MPNKESPGKGDSSGVEIKRGKGGQKALDKFKELKTKDGVKVKVDKGYVFIYFMSRDQVQVDDEQVEVIELYAASEHDAHFKVYNLPDSSDPLGHLARLIAQEGATVMEVRR